MTLGALKLWMIPRGQVMTHKCLTMIERRANNYEVLRDAGMSFPQYSVAGKPIVHNSWIL